MADFIAAVRGLLKGGALSYPLSLSKANVTFRKAAKKRPVSGGQLGLGELYAEAGRGAGPFQRLDPAEPSPDPA